MFKLWIMKISNKIKKSINVKLSLWIVASLIISCVFGIVVVQILKPAHFIAVHHVDYDKDRYDSETDVLNFINGLYSEENKFYRKKYKMDRRNFKDEN